MWRLLNIIVSIFYLFKLQTLCIIKLNSKYYSVISILVITFVCVLGSASLVLYVIY